MGMCLAHFFLLLLFDTFPLYLLESTTIQILENLMKKCDILNIAKFID